MSAITQALNTKEFTQLLKNYQANPKEEQLLKFAEAACEVVGTLYNEFKDGVDFSDFIALPGIMDDLYLLSTEYSKTKKALKDKTLDYAHLSTAVIYKFIGILDDYEESESINVDSVLQAIDTLFAVFEVVIATGEDGFTKEDFDHSPVIVTHVVAVRNGWSEASSELSSLNSQEAAIIGGMIAAQLHSLLVSEGEDV